MTKANKNRTKNNQDNNISENWYQERIRQTKTSFNLAICLATTTAIFGLVASISLVVGNISATTATTAASLVSGVASRRSYKLYEKASQSFDEAAKTLLDD
jgi:hypothetical protein